MEPQPDRPWYQFSGTDLILSVTLLGAALGGARMIFDLPLPMPARYALVVVVPMSLGAGIGAPLRLKLAGCTAGLAYGLLFLAVIWLLPKNN